jgi:hypothetical protein
MRKQSMAEGTAPTAFCRELEAGGEILVGGHHRAGDQGLECPPTYLVHECITA